MINFSNTILDAVAGHFQTDEDAATDAKSLGFSSSQVDFLEKHGYEFEALKERIDQGFTPKEIYNAVVVKRLHDKVEIAAYKALQECINTHKLKECENGTRISIDQSRTILLHIKKKAHIVLRAKGGYMRERGKYLNSKQFEPVISKVSFIVSDRDEKLTNASYTSLELLVANLDAHNNSVNKILFDAWGVPSKKVPHLQEIKTTAGYTGAPN